MEILPFGGYTTFNEKINSSINKDLIISLGGILFQIILFLILFLFKDNFNYLTYSLFKNYNLTILIFNLLPIIPLDGSKVMHLLLEKKFSYQKAYYLNFSVSIICIGIFIYINYIYHIDNYIILSFLIYKVIEYIKNYKYLKKRFLLERYLEEFSYQKIDNKTKSLNDLRKNVLHYFKENNKYINEKEKIGEIFDNNAYF